MHSGRFVGLSSKQTVPRLLSVVGNKPVKPGMKEVDVDAPPLSSSDDSDNDGLSTRGNIQPSRFQAGGQRKSPFKNDGARKGTLSSAGHFKRARVSARLATSSLPGTGHQNTVQSSKTTRPDELSSPPPPKKLKKSPAGSGGLGSRFDQDPIFQAQKKANGKTFGRNKVRKTSPAVKTLKLPPKASTPEDRSPRRSKKLLILSSPPPGSLSPEQKKVLRIPGDDSLLLPGDHEGPSQSQRPLLWIPDEIPDSLPRPDKDRPDRTGTPDSPSLLLRRSSSPATTQEDIPTTTPDVPPVCPFCSKPVDREDLNRFKERNPRMTVASMQRFCQDHKRRSARETWVQKGYPDIDWARLDERIAGHYEFLRAILESGGDTDTTPNSNPTEDDSQPPPSHPHHSSHPATHSHYDALFRSTITSGRNRTLLTSSADLTPGYYGIRGLRAMTEQLVSHFAPMLRQRALRDRAVSARGYTTYLQSVLVPELAVRLIMEDMGVGEVEGRRVLRESVGVGELLCDEVPDVVVVRESEEEEGQGEGEGGEDDDGW